MSFYYIPNEWLINFLLFLLIFILSSQILKKFFKEKALTVIISLIVALLSVFYLSSSQIDFLVMTYTTFGVLVLISIPLLVAFFFIYLSNLDGVFRKLLWIIFGGISLILLQNAQIPSKSITSISTGIIILVVLMIIFDKTIKNRISYVRNIKKK